MSVFYPTDNWDSGSATNGQTPISVNNITSHFHLDKDTILSGSSVNTLAASGTFRYPSSIAWGVDDVFDQGATTDTVGDFVLACNNLTTQIWNLSALVPGIYNTMSSGAAPSGASAPTNTTATEVQYIAQAFSLKLNDSKRKIKRLEWFLARLSDEINGAIGASGTQAPAGVVSIYPSSAWNGYNGTTF